MPAAYPSVVLPRTALVLDRIRRYRLVTLPVRRIHVHGSIVCHDRGIYFLAGGQRGIRRVYRSAGFVSRAAACDQNQAECRRDESYHGPSSVK